MSLAFGVRLERSDTWHLWHTCHRLMARTSELIDWNEGCVSGPVSLMNNQYQVLCKWALLHLHCACFNTANFTLIYCFKSLMLCWIFGISLFFCMNFTLSCIYKQGVCSTGYSVVIDEPWCAVGCVTSCTVWCFSLVKLVDFPECLSSVMWLYFFPCYVTLPPPPVLSHFWVKPPKKRLDYNPESSPRTPPEVND